MITSPYSSFDPLRGVLALQRELDRVFENPLPGWFDLGLSGRGVSPPVIVFSSPEGYVVRLEVPGIRPEDLAISTEGRTLTISGARDVAAPPEGAFHRRERSAGKFSRSLRLPDDLDLGAAKASCKNGILTIHVPKREEAKPRQISVQVT